MDAAPISTLTLDQLAEVLSHVPIRERLSTCSLVNSTWRTAAATATTAVTRVDTSQPERTCYCGVLCTPALGDWLTKHSARVQVTQLCVVGKGDCRLTVPVGQLRSLKVLALLHLPWETEPAPAVPAAGPSAQPSTSTSNNSAGSSLQGLEQLSALTQLNLDGRSVQLAGLASLTGLQDLSLRGWLQPRAHGPYSSTHDSKEVGADGCLLVDALPRLQQLTSLELKAAMAAPAAVACVRGLPSLQRLVLEGADGGFEQLPATLTALTLRLASKSKYSYMQPLGGSITRSNAAGLLQLTALQSLMLGEVQVLDLSLLAGMRGLRSLYLFGCPASVEWAAGSPDLQLLTTFTALTSLSLHGTHGVNARVLGVVPAGCGITAAEAAAVTSSSQLASLALGGKHACLQPEAYASLFPPGRLLQHLTMLQLSAELLLHPAAVRHAGSCCPNLQELQLTWPGSYSHWGSAPSNALPWADGQAALVAEALGALSSWAGLRELQLLAACYQFPEALWVSLGSLSQLTKLYIHCMSEPEIGLCANDVLRLQGCTALRRLDISAEGCGIVWELDIRSRAPTGAAPDVWLQLPDEVETVCAWSEDGCFSDLIY